MGLRRSLGLTVLVAALATLVAARDGFAACGSDPADSAAIASARALIANACPCGSVASHAAYVACARAAAAELVSIGDLPGRCKASVLRCARRSTCGKPGAVTCFRSVAGNTTCRIEATADKCNAPAGGSVCGGVVSSCCDSCTEAACAPTPEPTPTQTPIPSLSPTCTPHATCTPPPCPTAGGGLCSGCTYGCPPGACCPAGGCGLVCVTPTPAIP